VDNARGQLNYISVSSMILTPARCRISGDRQDQHAKLVVQQTIGARGQLNNISVSNMILTPARCRISGDREDQYAKLVLQQSVGPALFN
jgi:hypothetical protein